MKTNSPNVIESQISYLSNFSDIIQQHLLFEDITRPSKRWPCHFSCSVLAGVLEWVVFDFYEYVLDEYEMLFDRVFLVFSIIQSKA